MTTNKLPGKMDVQFSSHCGENVELSNKKNKASWRHRFSGGIAFSAQQLTNTTKLQLDLTGSGHVYIGIITHDPLFITNMRETLSRDVLVAKEIRVHNRLAPVNIFASTKEEKRCIVFECNGETQFKNVESYTNVWLFVYIKFGDLIALLHSDCVQNRCFHTVTGSNIHFLDSERRSLKLQVENPSAICCLNNRLKPGKYVTVKTRAITEDGHSPSQCHIKLGVVDLDPSDIKSHDPESFVIDSKEVMPIRWTFIKQLPKENCDGKMILYLTETGELNFSHSTGVEGSHCCRLRDVTSGISVILDLFRTEVMIIPDQDEEVYENVDKDYDYARPETELIENVKQMLNISEKDSERERLSTNNDYINMSAIHSMTTNNNDVKQGCKINPRMYRRHHSSSNMQICT